MDSLKVLGKLLTGSGWSEMICNRGVASHGVADLFLTAKHITLYKTCTSNNCCILVHSDEEELRRLTIKCDCRLSI